MLVTSPAYVAAHGLPRRIEELAGHAAVVFRQPTSGRSRPWRFRQRGTPVEVDPNARVRVNDGEGLIEAVKLGLGVTQVPDNMVAEELASGELVEVLASCRPEAEPISVVYPSGRLVPARVRVAIEALESLRQRA